MAASKSHSTCVFSLRMKLCSVFVLFALIVNACSASVVKRATNLHLDEISGSPQGTDGDLTDDSRLFLHGTCRGDAHKGQEVDTCVVDEVQPLPDKYTYLGWNSCYEGYVPTCGRVFTACYCLCQPASTMPEPVTTTTTEPVTTTTTEPVTTTEVVTTTEPVITTEVVSTTVPNYTIQCLPQNQ